MGYELNPFTRKLDKVGTGGAGAGSVNFSAGTTSANLASVTFANSNNVSFGLNAGTITASVVPGAGGGIAASLLTAGNTAGAMAVISTGTMYLAGGNNVTLSQDANSVTISGPNTVAQTQFVLSNSNGVSFGTNGSTVTATVRTDYQSAGAYLTTAAQSNQVVNSINGSTGVFTFNTGSSLSSSRNANSITFGLASNITTALQSAGAYLTTARASNDAVGLNTAQTNVTWTVNSGGISLNAGAYLTTAMASNRGTDFVQANAVFNGTNASGTIASNAISVSVAAPAAGVGIAAGTRTATTAGNLLFDTGNGITFGLNAVGGSIMTASHNALTTARASTDAIGLNTAQTNVTWTANSNGLSLNASGYAGTGTATTGNISVTLNSGGLSLNAPAFLTTAAQSSASNVSGVIAATASNAATNQTAQLSGNVSFANGSGVSFFTTANGAVSGVAASVQTNYQSSNANYLTSQSNQALSGSNGSFTFQTATLGNLNGLSFYTSNGSIVGSHNALTTARASNDAVGLNTAATNVTWTVNSSGISLNASAYLTTAMASNRGTDFVQANAAFAGTNASGTIASNGISISVAAPGGGAAPTASASNGSFTFNTIGFSNANNVTFGTSAGSIITASVAAPGGGAAATGSYFDNMFQQNSVQGITFSSMSTGVFGRVIIQPLAPGNELFPYRMTAETMRLNFSASATATAASSSHSSTMWMGIYTRVNSTQLSLLNSVSRSWGMTANTGNSASYHGARYLTVHSSQWSSQPVFEANSRYFFAVLFRSSNYSGSSGASLANSIAGMHLGASVQRSGLLGSAGSSGTSYNAWHPFMGVHSLTTHTAMPVSIANADINKASAYANFIPQVIFDAGLGLMN